MIAVLQSAAPDGLVVEGAVLTEYMVELIAGDNALRLDVTVSNLTDETRCIQQVSLDPSRWSVVNLDSESQPVQGLSTVRYDNRAAILLPAGASRLIKIELYRVHSIDVNGRYAVSGWLNYAPCGQDNSAHPRRVAENAPIRSTRVSYITPSETAPAALSYGLLEFVNSSFDGNDLFVTLRNVGDEPACIPYHELEANYVQVFDVQTGRRAESRGHAHQSRSMMHRIVPGETKDIRFQISHLFELDSMFGYRLGGSFEYAQCNAFQMNDLGFAIPIDGQASVLTYTYDPTTD
ncbi:hypothetical protein [Hyphobacterium sp.]|uniref:hypothetical protein n=1 Tax=Hyphobacterium sp. TaxID=2004662 RepID=UPI00374A86B1